MKVRLFIFFGICLIVLSSCQNTENHTKPSEKIAHPSTPLTDTPHLKYNSDRTEIGNQSASHSNDTISIPQQTTKPAFDAKKSVASSQDFVDIEVLEPSILLDIRYATADNFTQSKIYDCPKCWLRPEAADALVQAHRQLQQKKLGLKMYDCYRPSPYQQRLWDKVPNPNYVTPPSKGSMHSRGAAVDLTIVDEHGKELDMGTAYDFFGEEAHFDYQQLPSKVLANRKLLRETMESVGFQGIRTEWWHFSFSKKQYPLSDEIWSCQ